MVQQETAMDVCGREIFRGLRNESASAFPWGFDLLVGRN